MFTDNAAIGTPKSDYIKADNIMNVADKIKDKVNANDLTKIAAIANSMGPRLMNLKHFLSFMQSDKIFQKFIGP